MWSPQEWRQEMTRRQKEVVDPSFAPAGKRLAEKHVPFDPDTLIHSQAWRRILKRDLRAAAEYIGLYA